MPPRKVYRILIAVSALSLLTHCSSAGKYRYVPAENQTSSGRYRNEAIYSEPPNLPCGKVRIKTEGVVDVESKKESKKIPALHIRMLISNSGECGTWILNSQDPFVSFAGQSLIHAILVNADSKSLPKVEIQPGELQPIDFYFPFPPNKGSTEDLPEFDFHWIITAGAQKIRRITPFDRVTNSQCHTILYPYGGYPLGWGPSWWGPSWWGRPY